MRCQPPDLPAARVALDSAQAWAQADPTLGKHLSGGVPIASALLRWGADLLRSGRASDAATAFLAAVALAPEDPSAWTRLGIALDRSGAAREAAGCFERSLGLAKGQPETWLLLGLSLEKLADPGGAEEAYRAAVTLSPTSVSAWTCLAMLLHRKGDRRAAIEAFRASLQHGGPDAAVSASLGKVLYEEGLLSEAHRAYEAASQGDPNSALYRRMERRTRFLRDVIDGTTVSAALASLQTPPGTQEPGTGLPLSDEECNDLFETGTAALVAFGYRDAAVALASARVERFPASASAHYLLASLKGDPSIPRSPDDYLVESFDAFADRFEAQLRGVLGYDVPENLCALLSNFTEPGRLYDALDAGCGTGLCGPLIRPLARRLVGVDLSPNMLSHAARRGVYDELVREELTAFLHRSPGAFDLLVAADVLIYFGDLNVFFAAAASAVRAFALVAVSAEHLESEGRLLTASGRFAHAPDYVRKAADTWFELLECRPTTLRREGHARVHGNLFIMRRRPAPRAD